MTSPQAFEGLRNAGRKVHAPHRTIATPDHNVPTDEAHLKEIENEESRIQVEAEMPEDMDGHIVMDNLSTHKTQKVNGAER